MQHGFQLMPFDDRSQWWIEMTRRGRATAKKSTPRLAYYTVLEGNLPLANLSSRRRGAHDDRWLYQYAQDQSRLPLLSGLRYKRNGCGTGAVFNVSGDRNSTPSHFSAVALIIGRITCLCVSRYTRHLRDELSITNTMLT